MRSSNKSRSRNKNQNQNRRPSANVVNRVFDSSGPEGKVRGTPQQIIDKYQALARDAQLSGDRVAAENFLQHSEHYVRLLNEAMQEQNARREQQEAQQLQQQQAQQRREAEARANADSRDRISRMSLLRPWLPVTRPTAIWSKPRKAATSRASASRAAAPRR